MARVLIADDSRLARRLIAETLAQRGHRVVGEAGGGPELLELYPRLAPDLVTLDMAMPGMDGGETLARLMALDPAARVVMVSAVGQEDQVVGALRAGAHGYVLKPFEPARLVDAVDRALGERAAAREAPYLAQRQRFVLEAQRRIEQIDTALVRYRDTGEDAAELRRELGSLSNQAQVAHLDGVRAVARVLDVILADLSLGEPPEPEVGLLLDDGLRVLQQLILGVARAEPVDIYAECYLWRVQGWRGRPEGRPSGAGASSVLVVDDGGATRRIVEGFLLREGLRVLVDQKPADALERIQRLRPALAIVDLGASRNPVAAALRPESATFVRRVRDQFGPASLGIIVVSDRNDIDHRLRAFAAGADDYVARPFEPEEMLARVRAVLARVRADGPPSS